MSAKVEAAYAALYSRLSAIPGWGSTSRDWHEPTDQRFASPSLVVAAGDVVPERTPGQSLVWNLTAEVVVGVTFNGSETDRQQQLLAFVDAIDTALRSQPGESSRPLGQTTLGGAVLGAWIQSARIYEGVPETAGVVQVTVAMKVA